MESRIERLRSELQRRGLPGALVLNPIAVGYLSGFTGSSAALLVVPERAVLVTDSRYTLQARAECPGCEVSIAENSGGWLEQVATEARRLGAPALAIEAEHVTLAQFEQLTSHLEGLTLTPVQDLVGSLRRIKDADEIARIREACALADRTFEHLLGQLRPGRTEREIAVEIECFLRRAGAEKEAFDTIVASGPRGALPHARPGERRLEPGDFVTMDFGARVAGYHSDLTRTVVLGPASARQREVYGAVLAALEAAIHAIRPGAEGKEIDRLAREVIAARGLEPFGHGLGHGLGRTVHDHAALSPRADVTLAEGMVLTVEPGIYIEGWGGVRVEEDVLVTAEGCEVLTRAPRELIELPL